MTIDPSAKRDAPAARAMEPPLECIGCQSAEYLTIESIQGLNPRIPGRVAVEYSCGRCEAFYAHDASVETIAKVLTNTPMAAGVLKFGRHYIHCGEPMERVDYRLPALMAQESTGQDNPPITWRPAQLRCRCGFRIAVPM
ncbi:hypothetical protein [Arthrobacter sp. HLT1-20]